MHTSATNRVLTYFDIRNILYDLKSVFLEKYTKVKEWDNGYLVVMAKYEELPEVEEYIDLIPILEMLYYDVDDFLKPIKEVRIEYAA